MQISEISKQLLDAKEEKGFTFADLAKKVNRSEIWTAALLYGQAQASKEEAKTLCAALGAGKDAEKFMTAFADKGLGPVVPTDPLIYRLYEIVQVYGYPFKSLVHEKFGDGIMSAVDFDMEVERVEDPKGDRVKWTMTGKYLPYKKW
ncbi:MAG: cyanase [Desulfuromonadaceae bacterium]|nr:cyanase [Desulfuromonadaceae bacterium]